MNVNLNPTKIRTIMAIAADLLLWAIALAVGVAAEGFVLVFVLGIPVSKVVHGAEPVVWIAQFLQPMVTLPILALVLRWHGERWSDLGLARPSDWKRFFQQVAVSLVVLVFTGYIIRHLIIAPLHLRDSGTVSFSGIQSNTPAFLAALAYALFGVGLNEELQFRGFIQNRLATLFGGGGAAWKVSVIFTGLLFGICHASLGPANVVYAALGGMVLGALYIWADRSLWVVVIVHSLFDVLRLVQIYVTGHDLPF